MSMADLPIEKWPGGEVPKSVEVTYNRVIEDPPPPCKCGCVRAYHGLDGCRACKCHEYRPAASPACRRLDTMSNIGNRFADLSRAVERLGEVDYQIRKSTTPPPDVIANALRDMDAAATAWIAWRQSDDRPWAEYLGAERSS